VNRRLDEASWKIPFVWALGTLGMFALGWFLDEDDEPFDLSGEEEW
jgi:hypothetical protein